MMTRLFGLKEESPPPPLPYWHKRIPSARDIRFQDELGWSGLSKYFPLERHYEETMQNRKKKKTLTINI